jgi:protein-S-isoprenylcysteine O-methyltransferase Ste14
LVLLERSYAYVILATIHLLLFAWRAHLEESKLAAASPEYRAHMQHSGFLFPKLLRR